MEDQKKEQIDELNNESEVKEEALESNNEVIEEVKADEPKEALPAEELKEEKVDAVSKEDAAPAPAKEEKKEEPKKAEKPKAKAAKKKAPKKKKAPIKHDYDAFKIEESEEKKARRKKFTIIELIVIGIVIVAFAIFIIIGVAAPESEIGKWMIDNKVWNANEAFKSFASHLPNLIKYVFYVAIILAVCTLIRLIFKKKMEKSDRAKTVITLLDGLVKYGCAIAVIVFTLQALGVNAMAIFASIGILTLVIGLGCQSLIADVVAGLFIVFENEYNVGEIIVIGDFRGTVIEIGVRATKILDYAGNIKIVNNSDVSNVINMSRELSLAVVDCEFPYDVPIEVVEKLLKDNFDDFKEKIPAIIEGPFYKGVSGYGDSNVAVMIVAKCMEEDRYQVQRDLLRAYRKVFTEAGIDLSFNQVVVNQAKPTEYKVTKKIKDDAQTFVEEQKELSKNMEANENNG